MVQTLGSHHEHSRRVRLRPARPESPRGSRGGPNLDLNPGAIIALSPALTPDQKAVYNSWGPGKHDARFNFDGQNDPAVIPPAYGLADVNSVTFTGDGDRPAYWNRYVAVTQMHGHGSFAEPRLGVNLNNPSDLVEEKLAALEAYQLGLTAPPPPAGSFDPAAAERGRSVLRRSGTMRDLPRRRDVYRRHRAVAPA